MHCMYNRWQSKYLLLTTYKSFFSSILLWHISWSSGERCRFKSSHPPVRIFPLTLFVSSSSGSSNLITLFVSGSLKKGCLHHRLISLRQPATFIRFWFFPTWLAPLPRRWKCHFDFFLQYTYRLYQKKVVK
jgi:hypothetical protein